MPPEGPQVSPVALRWRPFKLPFARQLTTSVVSLREREGLLVELRDAEGVRGLGEAAPFPGLSSESVEDLDALLLEHGAGLFSGGAVEVPPSLVCALDTARLDLEGRVRRVSVASLLADAPADGVTVNAVIGDGPAADVRAAAQAAAEAGYTVIKLKVGRDEPMVEVARIAAARAGAPQARLRLDANGAWDFDVARAMLAATEQQRVELIEQPVEAGQIEQLTALRGSSAVRTAADEAMLLAPSEVIQRRAADAVVLKPMLFGGLERSVALANEARAAGLQVIVTSTFESSIGIAAALHVAAAVGGEEAHGLGTAEYLERDLVEAPLVPSNGRLPVAGRGLGVTLDEAALEATATAPWRELA